MLTDKSFNSNEFKDFRALNLSKMNVRRFIMSDIWGEEDPKKAEQKSQGGVDAFN